MTELDKRLQEIAINLDGFAFDPRTGEGYRLNGTGHFIFKCLRSGMSEKQISDAIAKEYDIPKELAFQDLQDFLLQLKLQGLIG